jgi:hypothetical protein
VNTVFVLLGFRIGSRRSHLRIKPLSSGESDAPEGSLKYGAKEGFAVTVAAALFCASAPMQAAMHKVQMTRYRKKDFI